ncbi:MAG TPA: hypothetical protein VGL02_26175 [Streptomyces sp.]
MRVRLVAMAGQVTVAVGIGAAGCGSGPAAAPQASSATHASPAAAPSTADPGAARFAALMRRLAAWSDTRHSVTATESVVADGSRVRFDGLFTWGSAPGMDVWASTAHLGLQRLNSADKTEVLRVGDRYYYRVDPQAGGPLKGRHWMRSPVSYAPDASGAGVPGSLLNPADALRMLPDATGWTDLGAENVDDTVAHHYRGTVTRAALSADTSLAQASGGSPTAPLAGADSAELDVWADAHGKPVHWVAVLGPGRSLALDLFTFGGPRTIIPPAARDTADEAAVRGRPAEV